MKAKYSPRYGCGKCQVGVPCEFRAPGLKMDYVFREGFGTGSHTAKKVVSGITGLLFGKE